MKRLFLNMPPKLSVYDIQNALSADSILASQNAAHSFFELSANFKYLYFAKPASGYVVAAFYILRRIINAFSGSIYLIYSAIAKKEMVRSNALTSIASMENEFSLWNFSEVQSPRKTMRRYGFIVDSHFAISSIGDECPSPEPATVSFMDKLPELFFWICPGGKKTFLVAILTRIPEWSLKYALAV